MQSKEIYGRRELLAPSKFKEPAHTEKWLPPLDLIHLKELQRKQVAELLREECETFSKDKDGIENVSFVQMEINLSDKSTVKKRYNAIHHPLYSEIIPITIDANSHHPLYFL